MILKDKELNDRLNEEGYVIIPFLDSVEISNLRTTFEELHHDDIPEGFYATTHHQSKVLRKKASEIINQNFKRPSEELLSKYQLLGGAYISKSKGTKSILPLHQDWNIVDEDHHRSYNIWVPLVDVDEKNGAVRILPKSHKKERTFRGPNLKPTLLNIADLVLEHLESLPMKAGEALIYDHGLWHASPENQTDQLRLAVVCGLIPENVEMKFYYAEDGQVSEYSSSPDFFLNEDPTAGPADLQKIRSVKYPFPTHTWKDFKRIYLGKKSNWLSFLGS